MRSTSSASGGSSASGWSGWRPIPNGSSRHAHEPEWIFVRFGRIAEAGGKVLRVTTIDDGDVRVVITAHFDRKATRAARKTDAHDV
jgi:hypothetical protein